MGHLIEAFLAVIAVVFTIFLAAAGKLVADECKAWAPRLTEWLIACAVARLPEDQRDLYREHWQSDVNDMPGDLSKVFWAARCILAAGKILPETEDAITSDSLIPAETTKIGRFLRRWGVDEMPQMLNVMKGEMSIGEVSMVVDPYPLLRYPLVRCLEIPLAVLFLWVTLPLALVVASAIRLESPGPVFISQQRVGKSGKPFRMLKFRTMLVPPQNGGNRPAEPGGK